MPQKNILDVSKSALLVVDVQEAFRGVVADISPITSRISLAIRGFQILERPIYVTEQYPKGLGRTVEEIRTALPADHQFLEKTAFSALGAAGLHEALKSHGISQVVLCGLETHACVNQTAHDLLDLGFAVHLLTDCVASRFDRDREPALSKMFASGVIASSVEMALFELMRDSRHEKFKEIQRLLK